MNLPKPSPETANAVHCAAFYIASEVPQHKVFHDMYSYWRIAHSDEASEEDAFKALTIYEILKDAHEIAEQRMRGEF